MLADTAHTRRRFLAAALAGGAGLALTPGALASAIRRTQPGGLILPWTEIAPGVHAMVDASVEAAGATGGNVLIVHSGGESLVIDSKFPYLGNAIRADAETLAGGATSLINTHHHADHTGGNHAFKQRPDRVQVMAHENAARRIRANLAGYQQAARGGPRQANDYAPDNERLNELARETASNADGLNAGDFMPTLRLGDEGAITVGQIEVAYRHHGPGHTDNDLALSIDGGRVLHTGDLVFNGVNPFFDPTAGVTARGWIESLDAVERACNPDTIVVPGHGPAGDVEIVRAQRRYLERLIEAVQADLDAGVSKEDAQAKTYDFMQGLGFESITGRAIGAVYDELNG
ncbi:MAG: MBL fold metallo-hydrolase [Phycisphaerales bacterium JB040]